eukprot:TRINITY_DN19447_c0_g4_i1.p1 TRINITY_DN19447_c0_g4~~TRINITY_DN19447_c0_g4_i1.p1  ORF type:complete len:190 (+),score=22.02 TRINITY_DN19447_c0_g4_i1:27-572(+)
MSCWSARVAVLAIRTRHHSSAANSVQAEKARQSCSDDHTRLMATNMYDTECLLEPFHFQRDSHSEDSDDDNDSNGGTCCAAPKRTPTSTQMQRPAEFVNFIHRRLSREFQSRQDLCSELNYAHDLDDLLISNSFMSLDDGDGVFSEAAVDMCRSPRVSGIPAASEYLAPMVLRAALKAMDA